MPWPRLHVKQSCKIEWDVAVLCQLWILYMWQLLCLNGHYRFYVVLTGRLPHTPHNSHVGLQIKSFIAKRVISVLVNLRYLRFKLIKYKENNICNTFDHNFKNIPLYMRKVLLCMMRWCPYFKNVKNGA